MQKTDTQRVKVRFSVNGVILEVDKASYAAIMVALGEAADKSSDTDWSAKLRKLRSELSRG